MAPATGDVGVPGRQAGHGVRIARKSPTAQWRRYRPAGGTGRSAVPA